jgi:hypothetical protein
MENISVFFDYALGGRNFAKRCHWLRGKFPVAGNSDSISPDQAI